MKVGIGFPNAVPDADGDSLREWAVRSDIAGFSALAAIDRLVYPMIEPLTGLALATGVTERIELMTSIVLAPLRNTAQLAKQAASVDLLSKRRLALGLAPGGRADDFAVARVDVRTRGKRFDQQLEELAQHFAGEPAASGRAVVPSARRGHPQVLIGGASPAAFRRASRHAGWIMAGGAPQSFSESLVRLRSEWAAAGRTGEPRRISIAYYALGDTADEDATRYFSTRFDDQAVAWRRADETLRDARAIKETLAAFEQADCDEYLLLPVSADPAQVDLLAEVVL